MGAANVVKAYHAWRQHLDDRAFCLLIYMALIARDKDAEPWFGQGHAALAEHALGMTVPPADKPGERDAVLRKVRRQITPLLAAGAICTRKRPRYGKYLKSQVMYRLHLDGPCDCEPQVTERPKASAETTDGGPVDNPNGHRSPDDLTVPEAIGHSVTYRPESIGHSVTGLRSQSDLLRNKEEELQQERISPEANLRTANCGRQPPGPVNGYAKPAIRTDRPTP